MASEGMAAHAAAAVEGLAQGGSSATDATSTEEDPLQCPPHGPPEECHQEAGHGDNAQPADAAQQQPQLLLEVQQRCAAAVADDPAFLARPLAALHAEAAALQKRGDLLEAVAAYHKLFLRASKLNVTHPDLHVCYGNCAGAYLGLGLHEAALHHAERSRKLAEAALRKGRRASPTYLKAVARKGRALLGMGRAREAAAAFGEGLRADPLDLDLRAGLQEAERAVLADLVEGRGRETRAIEYPDPAQRITYHPCAAPLHRVRTDDMLPVKLLTPFQAENDHHIKDTYNYVTVQADIKMPKRQIQGLEDSYFHGAFEAAISAAVAAVTADDRDCRVLNLGAGAGLHAMMALRAGAVHVTAVERWLYLALAAKEALVANQFEEERYKVMYKRPTDLALIADVPVCCNLIIANILDEGLLTSGLIPAVSHALASLATIDALVLPASATVFVQAVEVRTNSVCGLDLSAANLYRWHPAYAAGTPLAEEAIIPLSDPVEAWHFDLLTPPDSSATSSLDFTFKRRGRFNAVLIWYRLHLYGDVHLSTGPDGIAQGLRCLRPAVQYMAGELPVDEGFVLPVLASHNTVRMRFDIEAADYLHLIKHDASFPHRHFAMLADERKYQAYQRAIQRAVAERKAQDGEVHALDMGAGTGVLAMLAAQAGARSVVACDLHETLCDVARKAVAANGLSDRVSVVHRDAGLLQRGREVRALGVNLVVTDMFDAGLFGDGHALLAELARKRVMQPGATMVPAAATVYCMGVEALTGQVSGFDMSSINTYRWDANYEAVQLEGVPHRRLTRPARVAEYFFDGQQRPRNARDSMIKLEVVAPGTLNAIVFWFDLHLDDTETLTNAPAGVGEGGQVLPGMGPTGEAPVAEAAPTAEEKPAAPVGPSTPEPGSPASPEPSDADPRPPFIAADSFQGCRPGYVFQAGEAGLGYYTDHGAAPTAGGAAAAAAAPGDGAQLPPQQVQAEKEGRQPSQGSSGRGGGGHYWGQALQYLDRAAEVAPGRSMLLLAKREGAQLRFALRQGVGEWVPRAPWRVEWGGGASVENPHFQRVHYCELLVRDFLQRVRSRRFPSIELDMKMVLAHCGSLLLDPAAVQEVYHEMVVLERMHQAPEFSPGASLEALTRRPLRMH